jgi:hypothetical protein
MNESSGVSLVQPFHEAFISRDYQESVAGFLHEEVICVSRDQSCSLGPLSEWTKLLGPMRRYGLHSSDTLALDVPSPLGDDEHVIAIHHASAIRGVFPLRRSRVDVVHTDGDRIVATWSFLHGQSATDLLGSQFSERPNSAARDDRDRLGEIEARIRRNEEAATQ